MSAPFPVTLPPQEIERFQRDGFVVTQGVLGEAELSLYAKAISGEVARRTAHDARTVSQKNRYEQSFVQCMRLWETSSDIRPLTCHPVLAGLAAQLLQVDGVRLWQDQALFKEPDGRWLLRHQAP